eukprot:CAMPEP_0181534576 /NCGR_PEP_ID=MMETSP1110-20121109/73815_1 /TAXON_ID=174948 /ORGANISM="Symbiodinium sp., Strain CCMP421" /LENGTH=545 /DNA_ID=CAMNT_0023665937 /DNA_START=46 /DNA_END=1680 /DNA_ORIENTATION=+
MKVRLPLDAIWPTGHRWLQVVHMDHLLEITGLRLMLIIGCLISGVFGVSWILDFIQLRCLQHSPWSDEGVGKYSCLMKVGGGVMLLMMFRHSAVALAYYDEDGDRLQRRKERYLDEMTKQVGDVLQRATTQAQTLCGMLSAELDEKVGDHVRRMQKILQQCEKSKSPEAPAVYSRLTELMAIHLHHLRKPAIDHFQKLISLSGKAFFLEETLRQQRHTSMVKLLTVNSTRLARRMDLPRTETVQDDPELAHLIGAHLVQGADTCCSCCRRRPQTQQVASSLDKSFSLPTQADLVNELREPTQDELLNSPEAVVLQPVKLVLKWFEKIEPMQSRRDPRADVLRGVSVCGTPKTPVGQMKTVVMHLRDSPLYRSLLVGILFSVVIFIFHFHMLGVVWALLREGNQCKAVSFFMCCTELLRVLSVLAGMICYSLSLIVVIWNVEKLDAVLQVSEELHELHDFKAQIDALNANDLADEDSDISMLQVVERKLARQKRIVAEFYNNAWGDTLDDIRHFKKLAVDLEEGLHDPPTGPAATPAGSPQYTPLP